MKPARSEDGDRDRLGEFGLDYFTELTTQYVEDMPEARLIDMQTQADRNAVWFDYDPAAAASGDWKSSANSVEVSVSVYPGSPALTVGVDTRIPYHAFQANAAWILHTCADFGVGIDLDVKEETGDTWMFLFLRVFWAGYNYEVLTAAADDLAQCRKALEARLPIEKGRARGK